MPPQFNRTRQLDRLEGELFDVLVIGGGATGAGCALDAATRGLSVALVERFDFTSGTSSRSTKLIHGGVRYLEKAIKRLDRREYALVRDALRERWTLLHIAPHLVHRLAIVTPLYRRWQVPYVWAGLKIYDLVAGSRNIGQSRRLSASEAQQRFPLLRPDGLRGAVLYFDGQFDDARMNVTLAMTAAQQGAVVANYAPATGLLRQDGRVCGATIEDRLTGRRLAVRARAVINAAGPFCDSIRRMDAPDARPMLTVSSGVHIVLDARFSPPDTGLLIPKTEDGRVLFLLPWLGHTLVGTTDEPAIVEDHPVATEREVDYLLRHVRIYFDAQVERSDIKAQWSGLRPLVADPHSTGGTARLSRDHIVETSPAGLVTVTGGKWTTYRRMAIDAVDKAIEVGGMSPSRRSGTATFKLIGAERFDPDEVGRLVNAFNITHQTAEHLNRAYGDQARQVLIIENGALNHTLVDGHPQLEAEVVYAARCELAVTAIDVLARRMRLAYLDRGAAEAALPRVVELLADEHGWDTERQHREHEDAMHRIRQAM